MKESTFGTAEAAIFNSADALAQGAAQEFANTARAALADRDEITVILATGNSQLGFVHALHREATIDWSRIRVLHMDEYLGMGAEHPASFRLWMQQRIVEPFGPKAFYGIRGDYEPVEDELNRYSQLIRDLSPTICVMGIGENGHLAFNDPPADFDTDDLIRIVKLDEKCRTQQVNEGHFGSVAEVPGRALSLTVHALTQPETVLVLVPEMRKAQAVRAALEGPVTPECPASILQTKSNARIYLDQDSSSLLTTAVAS